MRALVIALRSLRREWRHGELAVLLVSLSVAVGSLTGVDFLVDRIHRGIEAQANEVLAADMRVESSKPISAASVARAQQLGLRSARLTSVTSAVFRGDTNQLANVRAVSDGYPLRGTVMVGDAAFGAGAPAAGIPEPGTVWAESRLVVALGARLGDMLNVGASSLKLTHVIIARPDQGSGFTDLAATVLMNDAELAATQLLQPGSRARHALLLTGDAAELAAFRTWHKQQALRERLQEVADGSPQIGNAVMRAGKFLALAGLVATLLCAVAVAMSARSYVRRHLDIVALMKTLGATRAFVLTVSVTQLLCLALAATLIGCIAGWVTQAWLVKVLHGLINSQLPAASMQPVLIAVAVAVTMLAGFALPSLLQLTRTPALRVLRRDVAPPAPGALLALAPALLALLAIVYGAVGEWPTSLWFVGGLLAIAAALALAGWLLVRLASHFRHGSGIAWRQGITALARRAAASTTLIVAFGLGVLLLLVLATIRRDLVTDWQASLPANLPNYFFINIPANQREDFQAELTRIGGRTERMLPMIRGRLVSVNGQPLARRTGDQEGGPFGNGEQNLTWTDELGNDNRIVAGRWWTAAEHGKPLVSLATEYRSRLDLKLGDTLSFDIAGETLAVTVASFREVKWDSLRPNFFIVFPPGLLDGAAGTWMTSAAYQPRTAGEFAAFVQRFPSVSVFNVGDLLAQVRAIVDKAVTAVQSVFVFTLLAGLTVLLAAVQASREERARETAVLRVLGARRRLIVGSLLVEYAALGLVTGLLAASAAAFAGYELAGLLNLTYRFSLASWVTGVLASVALVVLCGWLATRSVVNHPPRAALDRFS
jgi:putative ABC transport system permease protein